MEKRSILRKKSVFQATNASKGTLPEEVVDKVNFLTPFRECFEMNM